MERRKKSLYFFGAVLSIFIMLSTVTAVNINEPDNIDKEIVEEKLTNEEDKTEKIDTEEKEDNCPLCQNKKSSLLKRIKSDDPPFRPSGLIGSIALFLAWISDNCLVSIAVCLGVSSVCIPCIAAILDVVPGDEALLCAVCGINAAQIQQCWEEVGDDCL